MILRNSWSVRAMPRCQSYCGPEMSWDSGDMKFRHIWEDYLVERREFELMAIGRCYTFSSEPTVEWAEWRDLGGLDRHLQEGILCHAWKNRRYVDNSARTILVTDFVG